MNDNLLILLVFLLTQNKQWMENMRPALDFLESHKDALEFLFRTLGTGTPRPSAENAEGVSTEEPSADGAGADAPFASAPEDGTDGQKRPEEKKAAQKESSPSPLQGIANDEILKSILFYMGQNRN